jgi:hypothetical protein
MRSAFIFFSPHGATVASIQLRYSVIVNYNTRNKASTFFEGCSKDLEENWISLIINDLIGRPHSLREAQKRERGASREPSVVKPRPPVKRRGYCYEKYRNAGHLLGVEPAKILPGGTTHHGSAEYGSEEQTE